MLDISKGGIEIVVLGQVKDSRTIFDKTDTKRQVGHSVTLAFWGGEQYSKLHDATQASKFKAGDMIRITCTAKKFKDSMYPGDAVVTEVNGKSVVS